VVYQIIHGRRKVSSSHGRREIRFLHLQRTEFPQRFGRKTKRLGPKYWSKVIGTNVLFHRLWAAFWVFSLSGTSLHTYMCTQWDQLIHIYVYTVDQLTHLYIYTVALTYTCIYIHTCVHIYVHIYAICVLSQINVTSPKHLFNVHICVYIHKCIYKSIYIYT